MKSENKDPGEHLDQEVAVWKKMLQWDCTPGFSERAGMTDKLRAAPVKQQQTKTNRTHTKQNRTNENNKGKHETREHNQQTGEKG